VVLLITSQSSETRLNLTRIVVTLTWCNCIVRKSRVALFAHPCRWDIWSGRVRGDGCTWRTLSLGWLTRLETTTPTLAQTRYWRAWAHLVSDACRAWRRKEAQLFAAGV